MTQYRIESEAGIVMGIYEGKDEAQARDAYARDAGYADYATLSREVPRGSPQTAGLDDAIRAVEVEGE